VHDGVAPEAARAGAKAPEPGGLPRRGDERAVQGMRDVHLSSGLNVEQHNAGKRLKTHVRLPFYFSGGTSLCLTLLSGISAIT